MGKTFFLASIVWTVFMLFAVHAEDSITWLKMEQDGFTLEYEQNETDIAKQVLPEIIKRFKLYNPTDVKKELNLMKSKRSEILSFIASEIGLDSPGTHMSVVYDKFSILLPSFVNSLEKTREFRLWNRERLKSILASGGNVPGFSYSDKTDELLFNIRMTDPHMPPFTGALPLVFNRSLGEKVSQIEEQLHTYESAIKNIPGAGVICHEVAEIGISADIGMRGPFRRWLCEGAANHITVKALEKFIGTKAARNFKAEFDAKLPPVVDKHVDLAAWRALEWDTITPPWVEQDHVRNYYNHATKAFENYIVHAGPAAVPELFKRIVASQDKSDAGMYAALHKVTGKDIRTLLETVYPPVNSPFRGFAAQVLAVHPMMKKEDGSWEVMDASDVVPFNRDASRGFKLIMKYATLGQPVELRVEFIGEGMKVPDRFAQILVKAEDTITVDRIFGEDDLRPGPAVLEVSINGSVLQTRKLQIKLE